MAIDFPNSPTLNQTFTVGGQTWVWTGTVWNSLGSEGISKALTDLSDVTVTTPSLGQILVYNGSEWVNGRTLQANSANTVPLTVKAAASQTANVQEWQTSTGAIIARVTTDSIVTGTNVNLLVEGGVFGVGNTGALTHQALISSQFSTRHALGVKGATGQTVNLQEWLNSAGTVLSSVDSTGRFVGDGSLLTGIVKGVADATEPTAPTDGLVWLDTDGTSPTRLAELRRWTKTATAGQTVFSGTSDVGGAALTYQVSSEQVFLNGVQLVRGLDYFANNGTSVTLFSGAAAGDVFQVVTLPEVTVSNKQDIITGAATTITSSDLTASRTLISDGSGKVAASTITSTELGHLSGVTSGIQAQLNTKIEPAQLATKADLVHTHNASQIVTTVVDRGAAYTIVSADENTFIRVTAAGPVNMTIANVFQTGESVQFIQFGTGQVTFVAGAGVNLRSVDNKLKTNKQYSVAAITCVASGEYLVTGDLVA